MSIFSRSVAASKRRLATGDDSGIAMVMALFVMLLVTVLTATVAWQALNELPNSRHEQDYQTALGAAEAGVDDFIDRLDQNPNYATAPDASNQALCAPSPTGAQPTCTPVPVTARATETYEYHLANFTANSASIAAGQTVLTTGSGDPGFASWMQGWSVTVNGAGTAGGNLTTTITSVNSGSSVTLANAASTTVSSGTAFYSQPGVNPVSGTVYLTVQGTANATSSVAVSRTITVGLRPKGFLDALSTTSYNIVDPAQFALEAGQSASYWAKYCQYWAYQSNTQTGGTGPDMSVCSGLINYYVTGNVLDGPVESNDEYYICGTPQFEAQVTSGDPNAGDTPFWHDPAGCGGDKPSFGGTGYVENNQTVTFPSTDSSLQAYAAYSLGGCLYTGPTAITLNGTTMTVVSPDTTATTIGSQAAYNACVGTNVPLPSDGVIYVQSSTGANCNGVSGSLDPDATNGCYAGDAFVQGQNGGQVTIAADTDIIITGSLTYTSPLTNQITGLIATDDVLINHPVNSNGSTMTGTEGFPSSTSPQTSFTVPISNPQVDAAILALQHSFGTMNYWQGGTSGLGTITLSGALAEQFMQIDGVFSGNATLVEGYNENFHYDQRLSNGGLTPPHFINPVSSHYARVSYAEEPDSQFL